MRGGLLIMIIRGKIVKSFFIVFIYPGLQFKHYSLVSHRAPACSLDIAEHGNILITFIICDPEVLFPFRFNC